VQPPAPGGEQTYTVQRGDNLFRIGLRFGCHFTVLAQYNGISNPHFISVGQVIRIPPNC
jgi:nucleoid-associated protein YgaU